MTEEKESSRKERDAGTLPEEVGCIELFNDVYRGSVDDVQKVKTVVAI